MAKMFWLAMLCIFSLLANGPAMGDSQALKENGPWPQFTLPVPDDTLQRSYLGLKQRTTFSVDEIQSDFIIIQVYSMYCPICQREAPRVNQLYKAIDQQGNLSKRLKIVGIGAGNSAFEVDFYRQNYKVPFPLFPDGEFKIHKILGEVRTPYFYLLKRGRGGQATVIYQKAGGFKDPEAFLKELLKRAKITPMLQKSEGFRVKAPRVKL